MHVSSGLQLLSILHLWIALTVRATAALEDDRLLTQPPVAQKLCKAHEQLVPAVVQS